MARRDKLEMKLEELDDACAGAPTDACQALISKRLRDRSNIVVARAAKAVGSFHLAAMAGDLEETFWRFMDDPVKRDPVCMAKAAIVKSLLALDINSPQIYLMGSRHIQLEPSWGPPVDTAGNLRMMCANGLISTAHPLCMRELTRLLSDHQVMVRVLAVQALEQIGSEASLLLLQLKAQAGDNESEVTGEVLSALVRLDARVYLPFVQSMLGDEDHELVTLAALAISEARSYDAFEILRDEWEANLRQEHRRILILPLALTRQDQAREFLQERTKIDRKLAKEIKEALDTCFPKR